MMSTVGTFDSGRQLRVKEYGMEVARICLFNVTCQLLILVFCGKLIWNYDIKYIIICAWVLDLVGFISLMLNKKISSKLAIIYFIEKLLNVAFKVLIVIYFEMGCCIDLYFIPSIQLALAVGLLFNLVLGKRANRKKHQIVGHSYLVLYQIQMLLLSLKWNGLFQYSLYQTFILMWTVLGVNCFMIILLLINSIENCCSSINTVNNSLILWIIYFLIGLTVPPFLLLRNICFYYEDPQNFDQSIMIGVFSVTIIYILVLIFLTYRLRLSILCLFRSEIPGIQGAKQSPRKEIKLPKWKKLKMPILLLKVSASYFKIVGRKKTLISSISDKLAYNEIVRPDSSNPSPCQTILRIGKENNPKDRQSSEMCLICFENEPNVVLIPCRHGGLCLQCGENLLQTTKQCYLCRADIQMALRVANQNGAIEAVDVKKV